LAVFKREDPEATFALPSLNEETDREDARSSADGDSPGGTRPGAQLLHVVCFERTDDDEVRRDLVGVEERVPKGPGLELEGARRFVRSRAVAVVGHLGARGSF